MLSAWNVLPLGFCSWLTWWAMDTGSYEVRPQFKQREVDSCDESFLCLQDCISNASESSQDQIEFDLGSCSCSTAGHFAAAEVIGNLSSIVRRLRNTESSVSYWPLVGFIAQLAFTAVCVGSRVEFHTMLAKLTRSSHGECCISQKTIHNTNETTLHHLTANRDDVSHIDRTAGKKIGEQWASKLETHKEVAQIRRSQVGSVRMEKRATDVESRVAELEEQGLAGKQVAKRESEPVELRRCLETNMASPASSNHSDQDLEQMFAFGPEVTNPKELSCLEGEHETLLKKNGHDSNGTTYIDELLRFQSRLSAVVDEREVAKSELLVTQRQLAEIETENKTLVAQIAELQARYSDLAKDAQNKLVAAAAKEKDLRQKSKRSQRSFW